MTGKDVWKWLVDALDDSTILTIYRSKNLVCKGFRTNTIQDIKTNRKRLNANLFLNKRNYEKLLSWSKETTLDSLNGIKLADKETNELTHLAKEHGVIVIFIKLFSGNSEEKAIELFSLLNEENSELLDVTSQSIVNNEASSKEFTDKEVSVNSKKEQDSTITTKQDKKIEKLEEKIKRLTEQLGNRGDIHKKKIEQMNNNHQLTLDKLNKKNQLYAQLLKEKDELSKEYKTKEKEWDKERETFTREKDVLYKEMNELLKKHGEEKEEWNKEKEDYEEFIKLLEAENAQLPPKNEEKIIEDDSRESALESKHAKTLEVLVIGKPASIQPFKSDTVEFTFLEGKDVHNYELSLNHEAYWILSYELSQKEQFLLKNNDFYSQLDEKKITICKDFNDVKIQLRKYTTTEAGAF